MFECARRLVLRDYRAFCQEHSQLVEFLPTAKHRRPSVSKSGKTGPKVQAGKCLFPDRRCEKD